MSRSAHLSYGRRGQRLGVTVGDETVTLVEDTSNSSLRRHSRLALSASRMDRHELRTLRFDSRSHRGRSIDQRLLRSGAADGFLWPNLLIRPEAGRRSDVVVRSSFREGNSRSVLSRGERLPTEPKRKGLCLP